MCTVCFKKIFSHAAEAVQGDEAVRRALEYTADGEKTPSEVLKKGEICDGSGSLFLGGFKAVLNQRFMKSAGVGAVVNTAKGLEMFGPKYTGGVSESATRMDPPVYVYCTAITARVICGGGCVCGLRVRAQRTHRVL